MLTTQTRFLLAILEIYLDDVKNGHCIEHEAYKFYQNEYAAF